MIYSVPETMFSLGSYLRTNALKIQQFYGSFPNVKSSHVNDAFKYNQEPYDNPAYPNIQCPGII